MIGNKSFKTQYVAAVIWLWAWNRRMQPWMPFWFWWQNTTINHFIWWRQADFSPHIQTRMILPHPLRSRKLIHSAGHHCYASFCKRHTNHGSMTHSSTSSGEKNSSLWKEQKKTPANIFVQFQRTVKLWLDGFVPLRQNLLLHFIFQGTRIMAPWFILRRQVKRRMAHCEWKTTKKCIITSLFSSKQPYKDMGWLFIPRRQNGSNSGAEGRRVQLMQVGRTLTPVLDAC